VSISPIRVRFVAALAVLALLTVGLAACGGAERSADAYCRAFYETAAPLREDFEEADENAEEDPLGAIATILRSPGDLKVMLSKMAEHAPDEIKADTEAARDALEDQQDAIGDVFSDPLGAIGGGLIAGLTSSGSFSRIDAYLGEHCPVDSELAQEAIAEAG
jgi:hypothetical protein